MKRYMLLGTLIAFWSISPALLCSAYGQSYKVHREFSYDLAEIGKEHFVQKPIDKPREAVEYARRLGIEKQIPFKKLESQGVKQWLVTAAFRRPDYPIELAKQKVKYGELTKEEFQRLSIKYHARGEYWEVEYKSKGMLASFTCIKEFTPEGEEIKIRAHCGWTN